MFVSVIHSKTIHTKMFKNILNKIGVDLLEIP